MDRADQTSRQPASHPRDVRWPTVLLGALGALLVAGIWFAATHSLGVSWRDRVPVSEAVLNGEAAWESQDVLVLLVGGCNAGARLEHLTESSERVEVAVSTRLMFGGEGGGDCQEGVEVMLDEPLGERTLVDLTSGTSLTVGRR
ncbi:hypothetical protein [Salana multivorans]